MNNKFVFDVSKLSTFFYEITDFMKPLKKKLEGKEDEEVIRKTIVKHFYNDNRIVRICKRYQLRFPDCPYVENIKLLQKSIEKMKTMNYCDDVWIVCSSLLDLFKQVGDYYKEVIVEAMKIVVEKRSMEKN
jgi:hypothetical protein